MYFSVATHLIPDTRLKMGIAYYHPDEEEKALMLELMQCLDLEEDFKRINLDMIVPHFHITNDFENASNAWMVYLAIIFGALLVVGCIVEFTLHNRAKKKSDSDKNYESNITKGHINRKCSILNIFN